MFCTNCGSQVPDNSTFCTNCGAQMPVGQTANNQNLGGQNYGNSNYGGQPTAGSNFGSQNFETPNYGGQNTGNSNFGGQNYGTPNVGGQNYNNQSYNGQNFGGPNMGRQYGGPRMGMPKKNNTPIIIGAGIAGILVIVLLVFGGMSIFGGSSNSPTGVVKSFFKSISNEDVAAFKKTLNPGNAMLKAAALQMTADQLVEMNDSMKKELGSNWLSSLSYKETDSSKEDQTYTVEVTAKGEKDTLEIEVVKVGSNYYINDMPGF